MGMHRSQTGAELRQTLGGQVVGKCRCAQHYGGDDIDMIPMERTSFDHPVRANRLLVELDVGDQGRSDKWTVS